MIKIHFLVITLLAIIGFPSFIFTLYSCGKLMVRLQPILAYGEPDAIDLILHGIVFNVGPFVLLAMFFIPFFFIVGVI